MAESGGGRFAQTIQAGRHRLIADEPLGTGDDAGPTPYDLLLAALGACSSMTLRMYADRKGWPLEHVSVRLDHDRVRAEDCRDPSPNRAPRTTSTAPSNSPAPSPSSSARLLAIAERCPVHRTLTGEIRVETRLDRGTSERVNGRHKGL